MKRGEVWTAASGSDYAGKPRPVVILQSDRFDRRESVTVCLITTDSVDLPQLRIAIEPTAENGLTHPSRIMVDKIATIRRTKMGKRIGRLDKEDVACLSDAVIVFLGLGD
jgi:mRNA interferase MazF